MNKNIFITGSAGFIGFHVSKLFLDNGYNVTGYDNVNDYYDPLLKEARLKILDKYPNFSFYREDLKELYLLTRAISASKSDTVIHLAAQAGVRYSIENPHAYIESNIVGFMNILEACRELNIKHLIYASTSSVYGANTQQPFSTHEAANHPLTLYAATKKSNEMMAHSYSHLFNISTTGLRFFTVYGPYGRPDMALFKFLKNILAGNTIDVYNYGNHKRDFTYVSDIAESIYRLSLNPSTPNLEWDSNNPDPASSLAPYRIYNIGNNKSVELMEYIKVLEDKVGIKAKVNFLPLQQGDVPDTFANIDDLIKTTGFKPKVSIEEGISNFVDWYKDYYKLNNWI